MQDESFHCKPDTQSSWTYKNNKTGETVISPCIDSRYWNGDWECVDSSYSPQVWIGAPKHRELWYIDRTLVENTISCLQSGLENTQSTLVEHDRVLGRTTTKNRMWAETLEQEIKDTKECIRQLKTLGISHTTHYP